VAFRSLSRGGWGLSPWQEAQKAGGPVLRLGWPLARIRRRGRGGCRPPAQAHGRPASGRLAHPDRSPNIAGSVDPSASPLDDARRTHMAGRPSPI
jgi:hypothetical protein